MFDNKKININRITYWEDARVSFPDKEGEYLCKIEVLPTNTSSHSRFKFEIREFKNKSWYERYGLHNNDEVVIGYCATIPNITGIEAETKYISRY